MKIIKKWFSFFHRSFFLSTIYIKLGWKIHYLKSSYGNVISAVDCFFGKIVSKHCNTDGKRVWITMVTMLIYKHYFVTFHESILVNQRTFQLTPVLTSFGSISKEYLGQPTNFQADSFMNLIWSHFKRVSWSVHELFSWPLYRPHLVSFQDSILVNQRTFQLTPVLTSFGPISKEYLGQLTNFSADSCINLIWSHFKRVSWSAYELFNWTLYKPHLVTFPECTNL